MLPQASPCASCPSSRGFTRRSLALIQTPIHAPASPAQPVLSAGLKSQQGISQASQKEEDTVKLSLGFSPLKEELLDEPQSDQSPTQQSGGVSKQEEAAAVPDLGTQMLDLPVLSVEKMDDNPSEGISDVPPQSPTRSLSPFKTPASVHQSPQPPSLSFTLSPCVTAVQPAFSSPGEQVPMETQLSVSTTPDGSVIEVPSKYCCIYQQTLFGKDFIQMILCLAGKSWLGL